eukprot:1502913-Rhodomonas_salina.1
MPPHPVALPHVHQKRHWLLASDVNVPDQLQHPAGERAQGALDVGLGAAVQLPRPPRPELLAVGHLLPQLCTLMAAGFAFLLDVPLLL